MLPRMLRRSKSPSTTTHRRSSNSIERWLGSTERNSRLRFEPLEERHLLSATPGPQVAEVRLSGDLTPITQNERLINSITAGASLTVAFNAAMSQTGGTSGAHSVTNVANWQLFRDGSELPGAISGVSFAGLVATIELAGALGDGDYVLVAQDTLEDLSGNALDGDANGDAGSDFARTFRIAQPVALGAPIQVNETTTGHQHVEWAASDASDRYVAIAPDGKFLALFITDDDVFVRLFAADGTPLTGELQVNNSSSPAIPSGPSVAVDGNGAFIATWTDLHSLYARRITPQGALDGSVFQVNNMTASQINRPSAAMNADGELVFTWEKVDFAPDYHAEIRARRYDNSGAPLGTEFKVSTNTEGNAIDAAAALDRNGEFVVTWLTDQVSATGLPLYAQRYDSSGSPVGTELLISSRSEGIVPDIAMRESGDFVVTWTGRTADLSAYGVFAQRYSRAGDLQGNELTVAVPAYSRPRIAVDDDGDFAVVTSDPMFAQNPLQVQRYNALGVPQGGPTIVAPTRPGQLAYMGAIAMDPDGDFAVAWTNYDVSDYGVFVQRFGGARRADDPTTPARVVDVRVAGERSSIAEDQVLVHPISAGSTFEVTFSRHMAITGAGSVTNPANWKLLAGAADVSSLISNITYDDHVARITLSGGLGIGDFKLVATADLADAQGGSLDGDANGASGGDFERDFSIALPVALAPESLANTTIAGYSSLHEVGLSNYLGRNVGIDSQGNYTIVWTDDFGGPNNRVVMRRFNAAGVPLGSVVEIVASTSSSLPEIAMNADGKFVVVWRMDTGIQAQRFDASGVPAGSVFTPLTSPDGVVVLPHVAIDDSGGFVVVASNLSNNRQVMFRRFDSSGAALGDAQSISGYAGNVAMSPDGRFVITMDRDFENFAQRYMADGVAQGPSFRIGEVNAGHEGSVSVALDAAANMYATWRYLDRLFVRQFDADGRAIFDPQELPLPPGMSPGRFPDVAMIDVDDDGDYVISFSPGTVPMYGESAIYAQRFSPTGVPQGDALRVDSFAPGNNLDTSLAVGPHGNFVVAWSAADGDGDGVYSRVYTLQQPASTITDVRKAGDSSPIDAGERLVNVVAAGASLQVSFSHNMSTSGAGSVANLANWKLFRDGSEITGAITGITYHGLIATIELANPLGDGDYVLVAQDTIKDVSGHALDGDADGVDGGNFNRAFRIAQPGPLGGPTQVNNELNAFQFTQIPVASSTSRSVAVAPDGTYLVAFHQELNVRARRFAADGSPLGSEFQVNTSESVYPAFEPEVAADGNGDFVVVWSGVKNLARHVLGQKISATGSFVGSEFQVDSVTGNDVSSPSLAMNAEGYFVVSWTASDGSDTNVRAQVYSPYLTPLTADFQVNTTTLGVQTNAMVALDRSGDYVVTWSGLDPALSTYGIFAQRYNVNNTAIGSEIKLVSDLSVLTHDLATLPNGDFVVAWNQQGAAPGLYARRFSANGVPQGPVLPVRLSDAGYFKPSVALDSDGDLIVAWSPYGEFNSEPAGAQRFDAQGVPQGSIIRFDTFSPRAAFPEATVAMQADGDFVVAWTNFDSQGYGIYTQLYGDTRRADDPVSPAKVVDVRLSGGSSPIDENERLVGVIAAGSALEVTFSRHMAISGAGRVTDLSNWRLKRDGADISSQIVNIDYDDHVARLTLSSALSSGEFELTALDTLTDTAGGALDGDSSGIPGGSFVRHFEIAPQETLGSEFRVNTTTAGDQDGQIPASGDFQNRIVAIDSDGDSVVVWHSNDINSPVGYSVYAQRYNAAGAPQGSEFKVAEGYGASVAMDDDGDFVVVWYQGGVHARRFNPLGVAQGSEFHVDSSTTDTAFLPTVDMNSAGDFVVAWQYVGAGKVAARSYNALGVPQGSESTVLPGSAARVAMQEDGGFFLMSTSASSLFGMRFAAGGIAQGPIMTLATGLFPFWPYTALASDEQGNLVAAWTHDNGVTSTLWAQRFDQQGFSLGPATTVATDTVRITAPAISTDADGDFVVAWQEAIGDSGPASMRGPNNIFARRYNSLGEAQGSVFMVNTYATDAQVTPSVAMDADGDFLVAWMSYNQDGSGSGIYAQRFGHEPAPPALVVTTLETSPQGVEVTFNAPLDLSDLNLYNQNGAFGTADFTITGAVTGPVRGSLVVDPTLHTIQFIPTGGPLAPDTYTIVLKGGDGGFKNAAGGELQANSTTPMSMFSSLIVTPIPIPIPIPTNPPTSPPLGDYTTTFTIGVPQANAVTLSVPDFARGQGQSVNLSASGTTGIPIKLSTGQGVSGADFKLHYDPALLTITGVTAGPELNGASLAFNNATPGLLVVTVGAAGSLSESAGPLTLVNIQAHVPQSAPYRALGVLDLSDIHVYDTSIDPAELPVVDDDGVQVVALFGDSNGSGTYNAPDATLAQRIIVGITAGLPAFPLADPYLLVDVSGNGLVQSNDVTLIQRAIVGAATAQIPPLPSQTLLAAFSTASPLEPATIATPAAMITQASLPPIVDEAIARWLATGLSASQLAGLKSIEFRIANLEAGVLGESRPGVITLDDDAAGYGWFVDSSPADDAEFAANVVSDASHRMDLLTAVMHELGHELGLADVSSSDSLMAESLAVGVRK